MEESTTDETAVAGSQQPCFPSPYWTVEASVRFDGLRGTATLDLCVYQWFQEKVLESWSSQEFPMTGTLDPLLVEIGECLAETVADVSPF